MSLLVVPATPLVAQGQEQIGAVRALAALDARVAAIGYRIATAADSLCPDRQWHAGIAFQLLSQYPPGARTAMAAAFGLSGGPGLTAVVPGGPAAEAGLRAEDVLTSVDGAALPAMADPAAIAGALEQALADGVAEVTYRRGGTPGRATLHAVRGCRVRFEVVPGRRAEALADGLVVQLTSANVELAANDDELAATIAHEMAHNILRHRALLSQAGVSRGLLQHFGRSARLTRATELAADRMGVYLMDRAGFDPLAAVSFLERLERHGGPVIATTHPGLRTRRAAILREIEAIRAARARGERPQPPDLGIDTSGR